MKIVDRATFLAMPAGTLFSKYEPCIFQAPCIKGDTTQLGNDFWEQELAGPIDASSTEDWVDKLQASQDTGVEMAIDLDCQGRDGLHDKDQLFAVWSHDDVRALIERLGRALSDSSKG